MTQIIRIPYSPRGILNSYLLRGDRTVIVDSGFPGSADRIESAMADHGITRDEVSLILFTHGHLDHIGSAAELGRRIGAPLAMHPADAHLLETGAKLSTPPTRIMGHVFQRIPAVAAIDIPPAPVDVQLEHEATLTEWGIQGEVVHLPGHTPGSIGVLTDGRELVGGDFVISGLMGFYPRRPARAPFHQDFGAATRSIERVLELNPTRIWIGHGGPLDTGRLRRWHRRNRWHWDARARRAERRPR